MSIVLDCISWQIKIKAPSPSQQLQLLTRHCLSNRSVQKVMVCAARGWMATTRSWRAALCTAWCGWGGVGGLYVSCSVETSASGRWGRTALGSSRCASSCKRSCRSKGWNDVLQFCCITGYSIFISFIFLGKGKYSKLLTIRDMEIDSANNTNSGCK